MPNLNDRLARDENRLAGEIYKTSLNKSVWNKLIPKEEWTNGISSTQVAVTVERNLPDNIDDWTAVAPNAGSGNTCVPTADVVPRGTTERSYSLTQKAIESDDICVNDTRDAYMVNDQIAKVFKNLRNVVSYAWKRYSIINYFDIAEHKTVVAPGAPVSADHMPTIAATSVLTQKFLNKWYQYLINNSAEEDGGSLGMVNGAPQFILVTDMETSDDLMREDATANAFLYNNNRVPELLAPLGVNRAFRGFYHMVDTLPRRYTFAGGVWTEVQPYESAAASDGTKSILSPDYMAAPYTDSYIFLPNVMKLLHPRPISTVGSGTSFTPQSYVGDFKWLNIADRTLNPDNSYGFYRALLMSAAKSVHPEYGIVIRHLRCPGDLGLQACAEVTEANESDLDSGESFFTA